MRQRWTARAQDALGPPLDAELGFHRGRRADLGQAAETFGLQRFGDAGDGWRKVLVGDREV